MRSSIRRGAGTAMFLLAASLPTTARGATVPGSSISAANEAAARINLVKSDLPGWQQSPNANTTASNTQGDQVAKCSGAPIPTVVEIVNDNSPYFDQGDTDITSTLDVVKTRAEGIQDYKAMTGSKVLGCLEKVELPDLKSDLGTGISVSDFHVKVLHLRNLPGYSSADRFQVTLTKKTASGESTRDLVSDQVNLLVGRTEVSLVASQVSVQGFAKPSSSLENRLLGLLVTRTDRFAIR